LEILVRLKQTNDIQPFYAYSMEIPDHLILTPKSLPVRWKSRIAAVEHLAMRGSRRTIYRHCGYPP
jgi:hypothetical protein